jgi:hypothetical protein
MSNYRDLGFNSLGIRTIPTYVRDTPEQTRASAQPGSVIADGVNVSSVNLKIDKDGIYLGTAVPVYEEGRIFYNFSTHKLMVGGSVAFETVTSS